VKKYIASQAKHHSKEEFKCELLAAAPSSRDEFDERLRVRLNHRLGGSSAPFGAGSVHTSSIPRVAPRPQTAMLHPWLQFLRPLGAKCAARFHLGSRGCLPG